MVIHAVDDRWEGVDAVECRLTCWASICVERRKSTRSRWSRSWSNDRMSSRLLVDLLNMWIAGWWRRLRVWRSPCPRSGITVVWRSRGFPRYAMRCVRCRIGLLRWRPSPTIALNTSWGRRIAPTMGSMDLRSTLNVHWRGHRRWRRYSGLLSEDRLSDEGYTVICLYPDLIMNVKFVFIYPEAVALLNHWIWKRAVNGWCRRMSR